MTDPYAAIVLAVMVIAVVVYVLLAGADFGGGMWDLLAFGPRARDQREAIAHAIGPVWEANHVWLILVVVLLFAGFPTAFGSIMTALHIPLTAVLVGIVLRGTTFVFRTYDAQDDVVHRRWSTLFGVSSFLTPFLLGLALGGLATGDVRVVDGAVTSGFFAGWTTLFAVACGLFAQGMFAFLAAVYLCVETAGGPLERDFRVRAIASSLALAPAAALVLIVARGQAPVLFERFQHGWGPVLLLFATLAAGIALFAVVRRVYRLARAAAGLKVAAIVVGWALAQYPDLIPGQLGADVAAAPHSVMVVLVWALAGGSLVLIPSLYYLFRVFKSHGAMAGDD